eukprot:TRINITY_DN3912_c0_g2_i5.p1 TRINITY_DN3912_c0_g2~~TRINITY_DN3912_c0_g2_i5.p1  ORF type:complete len:476 (+),score=87.91 TRINITY_DN3912_c0_g2_i5:487-1914(+)
MASFLRNCVVCFVVFSTLISARQFPSLVGLDGSSLLGQSRLYSGYYEPEPSPEAGGSCEEVRQECEEQCQGARFSFHCSDLTGLRTKCYCLSTLASISGADQDEGNSARCKLAENQCDRDCDGLSDFQCKDDGHKFSQSCVCISGRNYQQARSNTTTQYVEEMNSTEAASQEVPYSAEIESSPEDIPKELDQEDAEEKQTTSLINDDNTSKQDSQVVQETQAASSNVETVDESEQPQPFLRTFVVSSVGIGQNTSSNTVVYKDENKISVSHSVSASSNGDETDPSQQQTVVENSHTESTSQTPLQQEEVDGALSKEDPISLESTSSVDKPELEVEQMVIEKAEEQPTTVVEAEQMVIEKAEEQPPTVVEADTVGSDSDTIKVDKEDSNVIKVDKEDSNVPTTPEWALSQMEEEKEQDDSGMHPKCLEAKLKCQKKCGEFKKPKFQCQVVGNSFSQGCSCSSDSFNDSVRTTVPSH